MRRGFQKPSSVTGLAKHKPTKERINPPYFFISIFIFKSRRASVRVDVLSTPDSLWLELRIHS